MLLETNGIIAVLIGLLLPAVQKVLGDGSVFQALGANGLLPAIQKFIIAISSLFGGMAG